MCTSLEVRLDAVDGPLLASGVSTVDQDVSFAGSKEATLYFRAADADGVQTTRSSKVYVDVSPRLVEIETVPGQIHDLDGARILYSVPRDTDARETLHIRDRATLADVVLGDISGPASLTDQGAIWSSAFWNGVTVTPHAPFAGSQTWIARGSWALGRRGPADSAECVLKDLTTGVETIVLPKSDYALCTDVAENGDAILQRHDLSGGTYQQKVYRYRAGVLTKLSTSNGRFADGRTDGINVAFQWVVLASPPQGTMLFTDAGQAQLAAPYGVVARPEDSYVLEGGWVAYTNRAGASTTRNVWLRDPLGTVTQVTSLATTTSVDDRGLGAPRTSRQMSLHDGTVAVISGSSRYLASTGAAPDPISSSMGGARWIAGKWHVVIGGHVFEVSATPACIGPSSQSCGVGGMQTRTCAAGVWSGWSPCSSAPGDAGASDAGISADAATTACNAGPESDAAVDGGGAAVGGGDTGGSDAVPSDGSEPDQERGISCRLGRSGAIADGVWALAIAGLLFARRRTNRRADTDVTITSRRARRSGR